MTSTNTTPAREWRSAAACRGTDPELYFPVASGGPAYERQVVEAKAVCAGCPVREQCLAEALMRIPDGIAGGLTPAERRQLARGRAAHPVSAAELIRVARGRAEVAAAGSVLLASGRTREEVARACGVSERTVYRWRAAAASSMKQVAS